MKPFHNRPATWSGVVVGAMLAVPLVAVFYLAWRLAGLPFVPFDVFDWMTRTLPGPVVTLGIDTVVSVIRGAHLGATAETAKAVEKTMAVSGVLATGGLAGAALFGLLRASRGRHPYLLGVCAGAALGAPAAFISRAVNQSATASHTVSALWSAGS